MNTEFILHLCKSKYALQVINFAVLQIHYQVKRILKSKGKPGCANLHRGEFKLAGV